MGSRSFCLCEGVTGVPTPVFAAMLESKFLSVILCCGKFLRSIRCSTLGLLVFGAVFLSILTAAHAFEPDMCRRFYLFDRGSRELTPQIMQDMKRDYALGTWCQKNVRRPPMNFVKFFVRGNSIASEGKSINELAIARAKAVADFMESMGFPMEVVEAVSDGNSRPLSVITGNPSIKDQGYVVVEALDAGTLRLRERSERR